MTLHPRIKASPSSAMCTSSPSHGVPAIVAISSKESLRRYRCRFGEDLAGHDRLEKQFVMYPSDELHEDISRPIIAARNDDRS